NPLIPGGFLWWSSATAALAAAFASLGTYLYTVIDCHPEMMFCTPWTVASCPDSAIGLSFFAFSAAITAPAMLSFAAMAPSILLLVLSSICSKIGCALGASQSGTNCCGPLVSLPLLNSGFRTASFPLLNQNAF